MLLNQKIPGFLKMMSGNHDIVFENVEIVGTHGGNSV
jgi:hypothetical protein